MSLGCFSILYEWKHTCIHFSVRLHVSVKFIHTVEHSSRSFICTAVWSPCFIYNTCHNQSLCICWHFKKSASTGKLVHWKEGLPCHVHCPCHGGRSVKNHGMKACRTLPSGLSLWWALWWRQSWTSICSTPRSPQVTGELRQGGSALNEGPWDRVGGRRHLQGQEGWWGGAEYELWVGL